MKIKIDYKRCCWSNGNCNCKCSCESGKNSCRGCAEVCPTGAIMRKNKVVVDHKKCIQCGACVTACPNNAISLID